MEDDVRASRQSSIALKTDDEPAITINDLADLPPLVVGEAFDRYYKAEFEKIERGETSRNWAAALFGPGWCIYRRLDKLGWTYWGMLFVVQTMVWDSCSASDESSSGTLIGSLIVVGLGYLMIAYQQLTSANRIYQDFVHRKILAAFLNKETKASLRRRGMPSAPNLIAFMLVTSVLGLSMRTFLQRDTGTDSGAIEASVETSGSQEDLAQGATEIPIVRCSTQSAFDEQPSVPSDDQIPDIREFIRENGRTVTLPIAFYIGSSSKGVFAPEGWSCGGGMGSSGGWFQVTESENGTAGGFLHSTYSSGATSGRYTVYRIAKAFFRNEQASFIADFETQGLENVGFDSRTLLFANDKIEFIRPNILTYSTPGNTPGLGTVLGSASANAEPIVGFLALVPVTMDGQPAEPNAYEFALRLPGGYRQQLDALNRLNAKWQFPEVDY